MAWRPIVFTAPEANDVLKQVGSIGVEIALDVPTAVKIIDDFLQRYKQCFWAVIIFEISAAIREELLKSRNVIDTDLVGKVVDYLEKDEDKKGSEDEESEEEVEDAVGSEKKEDGVGSDEESEEDSGEEDGEDKDGSSEDSYSEDEEDFGEDSDDDGKMEMDVANEEEEEEEEIDEFEDPARKLKCMEDLKLVCKRMGLVLKPGQEEKILDMMLPYVRGCPMYRDGISIFLKRVREHIAKHSTLDDLKTVEAALESKIFREEYEDWKKLEKGEQAINSRVEDVTDAKDPVNQQLKKNMVPTKEEEGSAYPMNQIKPEEKRECGDTMKIEEMENMTPLNLAEQAKESMGNAYSSCIKESSERGGAIKRKLGQI